VRDIVLVEDQSGPLPADRLHATPCHPLFEQAGEGPLGVRRLQFQRSAESEIDRPFTVLVGELWGPPRRPPGPEHGHPMLLEGPDLPSSVVLVHESDIGRPRGNFPLGPGEDDLSALDLDSVLTVA